jgi:hypothetical protein
MPYADVERRKEYSRQYRLRNRTRLSAQTRAWKQRNPTQVQHLNSKSHYKRCSEDVFHYFKYLLKYSRQRRPDGHTLTHGNVVAMWNRQEGKCALTGIPLTHTVKANKGKALHTNVSLDRIDPKLPYSASNVQLVCWIVNVMRRDLSPDEFRSWCGKVFLYSRTGVQN